MTPQELSELLLIYAAGAADAEEIAQIESLLASNDPAVQTAYAEAMAVVHSMPMALDPVEPPKAVRDRVMSHALAAGSPVRNAIAPMGRTRWPQYTAWAAAACFAIALTAALVANQQLRSEAKDRASALAAVKNDLLQSRRDALQMQIVLGRTELALAQASTAMRDAQSVLQGPDVTLASMKTADPAGAFGRVLYSAQTGKFQVMVFNLKAPPPGKVYELWLITDDQKKLPAGTFTVDENGRSTIMAQAPLGSKIALAAVTDEPLGGVQVPTGSIQLAGETPVH